MPESPFISFIVSSSGNPPFLRTTLDSLLTQQDARTECLVVSSTPGKAENELESYRTRVRHWECVSPDEEVHALNRAFATAQGELLWWLGVGDKLCPWAARLAAFVFNQVPQVQWLTSGTPLVWTPAQLAITAGLADGYAKRAFFAGRNLATSPYYHFPIWRAGTVWTKSLWEASGGRLNFSLAAAGDFELWMRFWENAELYTINIPIAGRQADSNAEPAHYWDAAAQHLSKRGNPSPPSKLTLRSQAQLMRRIPSLRERFAQPAPHVWISPPTLECGVSNHYIL